MRHGRCRIGTHRRQRTRFVAAHPAGVFPDILDGELVECGEDIRLAPAVPTDLVLVSCPRMQPPSRSVTGRRNSWIMLPSLTVTMDGLVGRRHGAGVRRRPLRPISSKGRRACSMACWCFWAQVLPRRSARASAMRRTAWAQPSSPGCHHSGLRPHLDGEGEQTWGPG